MIAESPLEAGGVNVTVASPSPGVAVPIVGAPGGLPAVVIMKACVAVPLVFVAVTMPL